MKNKNIILCFLLALLVQEAVAQTPKWVDKARKAVCSVVTYDKEDKLLNTGNAFFITTDGVALSDFSLFKGAQRAVAINSDGTQLPVVAILGADGMYDVVKFKVEAPKKGVTALVPAQTAPSAGGTIYLLPYSTQKGACTQGKVQAVDKVSGNHDYFTLELPLKDKMVSCPLMTTEGEVFGLAQKASGQDTATICYAISTAFAMEQSISALSLNDHTLNEIGIKKALPDTEEQALVFLYMASSQLSADAYMVLLNDFIAQYPNSADGYLRRALHQLQLSKEEESVKKADADLEKALDVAVQKDDVRFNRAKTIYAYALEAGEKAYKEWTLDRALDEVREAISLQTLPIYRQLEGDILFAKQDFQGALASYEQVNKSKMASPETFFTTAKIKEALKAPAEEVLALLDSCVVRFTPPYTAAAAPYLLERAQAKVEAGKARYAMQDFDAYFNAVNGNVNDVFYYYREQAALKAKQYQRALDDIAKAIELNPAELSYRAELAVVNIRIGRNEQAIRVLDEALKLDANYAEGYRLKGLAYIQLKKKAEACDCFAKAKELGDTAVDALIEKHCK